MKAFACVIENFKQVRFFEDSFFKNLQSHLACICYIKLSVNQVDLVAKEAII